MTSIFEEYGINISHTHSGLDNLCFFVEQSEYRKIGFSSFVEELKNRVDAERIQGYEDLALLAVIGHNLSGRVGIMAKIFGALAKQGISVRTIYQSISECNVIIGVDNGELTDGIRTVYAELLGA